MPFDPPSDPGLQHQLIREWSDPFCCAHAAWLTDLPRRLRDRAAASTAARRVLNDLLRRRAQLPPLASIEVWRQAHWATARADAIADTIERAGWLLLEPWAARCIERRDVESVVGWIGRERYEACLAAPAQLWRGRAPPVPHDAAGSSQGLRGFAIELGWQALSGVLTGPRASMAARLRLVTGRRAPGPLTTEPLAIDAGALLARLQTQGPQA